MSEMVTPMDVVESPDVEDAGAWSGTMMLYTATDIMMLTWLLRRFIKQFEGALSSALLCTTSVVEDIAVAWMRLIGSAPTVYTEVEAVTSMAPLGHFVEQLTGMSTLTSPCSLLSAESGATTWLGYSTESLAMWTAMLVETGEYADARVAGLLLLMVRALVENDADALGGEVVEL
jgi:hypothetical protein